MRCLEVWINSEKIALVGHSEAETLLGRIEVPAALDTAVVEFTAELDPEQRRYASWLHRPLALGDELRIVVVERDDADPAPIFEHGIGEIDSGSNWPLCALCGKSFHESYVMMNGRRAYVCDECMDALIELRRE